MGHILDLSLPRNEKSASADVPTGASFPLIFTFHSEFGFLQVSYPQRASFGCSFHVSGEEVLASGWKVTKSGTLIRAFEVVLGLLVLPVSLLFGSLWNMNASSLNPSASPLGRAPSVPCFYQLHVINYTRQLLWAPWLLKNDGKMSSW